VQSVLERVRIANGMMVQGGLRTFSKGSSEWNLMFLGVLQKLHSSTIWSSELRDTIVK